jgi:hypothetical protein
MRRLFAAFIAMGSFLPRLGAAPETSPVLVVVGRVGEQVLSSRDVLISEMLERVLSSSRPYLGGRWSLEGDSFKKQVTALLLEKVVFLEAENLRAAAVSATEIKETLNRIQDPLKNSRAWQVLAVTPAELETVLRRKLTAKRFIQFKAGSSVVRVTDQDALSYYEANRERFGQLPFAQFKTNIKAFLTRRQLDERLRDWFDVLQTKYNVRNVATDL